MSRLDSGNSFSQNRRIGTFSEWAPIQSPRAGWAVRHTLIAMAALTVLAVGLHWWRTRGTAIASGVLPAISFHCDSGSVASLVFSPKGDELFVAATSGVVEVYDAATGRRKRSWNTAIDLITHLALSADGSVAMTAGYQFSTGTTNGIAKAWDLSNKEGVPTELTRITKGGTYPSTSTLSPDGTQLALAWQPMGGFAVANNIHVFDVPTGMEKFACTGHTSQVAGLTFSPDGKTLVSVALDNTIRQWDLATGQQSASWPVSSTGAMIAFWGMGGELLTYSADGKSFAVGGLGIGFEIRDTATGAVRATAPVQADAVPAIAFSPDGTLVAAAGNTYLQPSGFLIRSIGVASGGSVGLAGNTEGTAGLWDSATGKPLVTLQQNGPGVQSLAFSPDGKWIALGDQNGVVSIWDVDEVLAHKP